MNKVILMGRLTRDPSISYTQANSAQESTCVARYALAVDRRFNRDGQKVYTTDVVVEEQEFAESKTAGQIAQQNPAPMTREDGFMEIPDGLEEELPFS